MYATKSMAVDGLTEEEAPFFRNTLPTLSSTLHDINFPRMADIFTWATAID